MQEFWIDSKPQMEGFRRRPHGNTTIPLNGASGAKSSSGPEEPAGDIENLRGAVGRPLVPLCEDSGRVCANRTARQ